MPEDNYKRAYEARSREAQELLITLGDMERERTRLRRDLDAARQLVDSLLAELAKCKALTRKEQL
jgi:hypothetical protein